MKLNFLKNAFIYKNSSLSNSSCLRFIGFARPVAVRAEYSQNKNLFLIYSRLFSSSGSSLFKQHMIFYPTPANLSYAWTFGSLSAFCLGIQFLSGIFLAMHYNPSVDLAFASVEHIMRDVQGGWFIRYLHSNGASAFFAVVYLHILRALFYRSFTYVNLGVWFTGILIFILMMATAFIGYVLPWGQMSFWGATVITNLFSVIPIIGPDLVHWLWGGYSVGAATLNRFFSLHYLFPFIIVGVVVLHLFYLHNEGSSNPFFGESRDINTFYLPLYPFFLVKDLFGLSIFGMIFSYFLFFEPNALGHPDNYIEANSMVTPEHIVPEWYFRAPEWVLSFVGIFERIPVLASFFEQIKFIHGKIDFPKIFFFFFRSWINLYCYWLG